MKNTEINKTIGVRLAALMASYRIPREQIAAALGKSPAMIRRFENARSEMSAADLVLAAKALGVTSAILTGEEQFRQAEAVAE